MAGQAWLIKAKHSSQRKDLGLSGLFGEKVLQEVQRRYRAGYCSGTAERDWLRVRVKLPGERWAEQSPESFYWWKYYHTRFCLMRRTMVKTLTLLFCLFSRAWNLLLILRKAYRRSLTFLTWPPWLNFLSWEVELALFGCVQRWAQSLSPWRATDFCSVSCWERKLRVFYKEAILAGLVSLCLKDTMGGDCIPS